MPLPASRPRALLETLEPRILYSADLATLAATTLAADSGTAVHEIRLQPATATTTVTAETATATATEIAFVDLGIPDAGTLVSGLQAQREAGRPIEVVGFAAQEDGLAVISRTLAERQARGETVEAVHVFSHGQAGEVRLGAVTLDANSLLVRAGEIAAWGGALGVQADLLLYGCEVAADASGLFLIEGLAALTGADVAASDDLTGRTASGADWVLEQRTGSIEAAVAAEAVLQQTWAGVLGSEFQVNTTTSSQQTTSAEARGSQQAVAMDADGNFVVVWTSHSQDGDGQGVYARRFAFDGTALTDEVQVNVTTASDQQNARVVSDAAGNFVVVWSSDDQDGTLSNVYLRRFSASGKAVTDEVRANATDAGAQSNAVIGLNASNGDVVVAWQGDGTGVGANVFFRRFAADGTALDAADQPVATTGTLGGEQNPTTAMDTTGRFVVAWERDGHVYFQRHDSAGAAAGSQTQADSDLGAGSLASVAMNGSGDFMFTYRKEGSGLLSFVDGVWSHAFGADGSPLGSYQSVEGGDATSSSISFADDGSAIVVYQRTGGTDHDGLGVYARRLNATGNPQGSAFLVNQTLVGSQGAASLAVHDLNHFVVAWSGRSALEGDGVLARVFAVPTITTNGGGSLATLLVDENATAVTSVQVGNLEWSALPVSYTITGGADQARFSIDSQTGVLTFLASPDAEHPVAAGGGNVYHVTVQASDGPLTDAQTLQVTVNDVNEFAVGPVTDQDTATNTVREDAPVGTVIGLTALATDADGTHNTITYSLTDSADGRFAIDASRGVVTVARALDAETAMSHTITVQAASADGSVSSQAFTLAVQDVDEWAVGDLWDIDAAADRVREDAAVGAVVGVQALAIDADATNSTVTYSLASSADGRFAIDANSGVITVASALDAESATTHRLYVLATSLDGSLDLGFVEVAVQDVDEFDVTVPIDADAAANLLFDSAEVGTRVGITAFARDADISLNQVTYTLADDAGGRFVVQAGSGVVTLARSVASDVGSVQSLVVQATSADGSSTTQRFSVAIDAADPVAIEPVNLFAPVITSDGGGGSATLAVPENTTTVTTVVATDADVSPGTMTYTLAGGADAARFALDASSGVLRFVVAPDAEQPLDADGDNRHEVVVQVSDGLWTDTQVLTVTVTDANEVMVGTAVDVDAALEVVQENAPIGTRVGVTAQATDADATNRRVTYALDDTAGGRFAIQADSGVVTVAGLLDAEVAMSHTIVVRAMSSDGSATIRAWTLAVQDVDEFDVSPVADTDLQADSVREDAPVGTVVGLVARASDADVTLNAVRYTLAENAGGHFAIDAGTGLVTVAQALDAESAPSHAIVVQATSADGSTQSRRFTVTVQDVDEFDLVVVTDTSPVADAVSENAPAGTLVGVTALAVDADVSSAHVTYRLDDTAGGRFAVDATTGIVTLARSIQEEGVASRTIVLRATSVDGSTVAASFTLAIGLVNDAVPVIDSDGGGVNAVVSVTEGQAQVTQVSAHDTDLPAPAIRYALVGGADAAAFTLDATSGVLRFVVAPDADSPADIGADNAYDVIVQASDGQHTDEQVLRITVQPVNDLAPRIVSDGGGATALRHVAENTVLAAQVQALDADLPADTLVYALAGGADAGLFTIDATRGELRWRAAPDREVPLDADADQHYEVVVSASDGLHVVTQALTLVVDNVDEAPSLDSSTLAVVEGGTARPVLVATDVDTPAVQLVYTVQAVSGGRFESSSAPGMVVTRFTQADVEAGTLEFVTDGGEGVPAYRLVLADDTWTLVPQAAVVTFTSVNDAPEVAAVDLGTVDEDQSRLITAAALLAHARDAEGDSLSVSALRLTGGEGGLVDLGGGRWRFDPAADWSGVVTLAGEVGDGQAGVALAASLQVLAVNDAPRIVSGSGAAAVVLDLVENTGVVAVVQGTDIDRATVLHYAVAGGADAALFRIDEATGMLSFAQVPDREHPADADGDNRYEVIVEVSDGELRAQQALGVTVTNLDEAPVILHNTLVITDGVVTLRLQASDPDTPATALTFQVEAVQDGQFEQVSAPGEAVVQFTQADIDAARVVWVAPTGSVRGTYALRLSDGHSDVGVGAPVLERRSSSVTTTTLAVPTVPADDASASAASALVVPSALSGSRIDALPAAGPEMSAEAGLGLGQGITLDPVWRGSPVKSGDGVPAEVRTLAMRVVPATEVEREDVVLDLLSERADAPKWLMASLDLWVSGSGSALAEQMDRLRHDVAEAQQVEAVSLASTALVSTGLSVGYVVWLVRGGVLMTSLMSAVPAWAGMDPLPVLAEMRRAEKGAAAVGGDDGDDGGDDPDPIEKLFSKARRLLTRPADTPTVTPEASA